MRRVRVRRRAEVGELGRCVPHGLAIGSDGSLAAVARAAAAPWVHGHLQRHQAAGEAAALLALLQQLRFRQQERLDLRCALVSFPHASCICLTRS